MAKMLTPDCTLKTMLSVLWGIAVVYGSVSSVLAQPAKSNTDVAPSETEEFIIKENDSTIYTLKLAYNRDREPAYFFRNVFTPVCFTDVCKPVYIDLYWDLLGNYVRFEVPADEPLTKVDHVEFEEEDYEHLHRILSNPESLLKDFTIYQLVDKKTYNLSDTVDAVTGATPKTIKNEVIAGAVYTCFTLWHIANGPVVQQMKNITEQKCSDKLLHTFLRSGNHHYQYWAIEKVLPAGGELSAAFLPDMKALVAGSNVFVARHALERMPDEMFAPTENLQQWLWSVFESSSYPMQMAILEKLRAIPFSDSLTVASTRYLGRTNEEQFFKILELLRQQKHFPEQALTVLGDYLESGDRKRSLGVYETLAGIEVRNADLRRKMKHYKKSNR